VLARPEYPSLSLSDAHRHTHTHTHTHAHTHHTHELCYIGLICLILAFSAQCVKLCGASPARCVNDTPPSSRFVRRSGRNLGELEVRSAPHSAPTLIQTHDNHIYIYIYIYLYIYIYVYYIYILYIFNLRNTI
jgi:hypothetical protein